MTSGMLNDNNDCVVSGTTVIYEDQEYMVEVVDEDNWEVIIEIDGELERFSIEDVLAV